MTIFLRVTLHGVLCAFLIATGLPLLCVALHAQSHISSPSQDDADRIDARAFSALFRRAVLFETMAKAADDAGTPKPHLRKNLATEFKLEEPDSKNLLVLAQQWNSETGPLLAETRHIIRAFHASYPDTASRGIMSTSFRDSLTHQQALQDEVTLFYRDRLHNAMRENEFRRLQKNVRDTFGGVFGHARSTQQVEGPSPEVRQ